MPHEITMTKDKSGWSAKTTIQLPGVPALNDSSDGPCPAFLEIFTGKNTLSKGLRAYAHVGYKTPYGFRTRISFAGDKEGDWSRQVTSDKTARCTEKTVRAMHEAALAVLPTILALIGEHYEVASPDLDAVADAA